MASRKGSPNKIGAQVKENVVAVFTRLGGTAAMATWARKNQTEFYRLYGRLIPTDMTATVDVRGAAELSDAELLDIATRSSAGVIGAQEGTAEPTSVH